MNEKSKGGKRPGAGRRPSPNPKVPITIYVEERVVEKWGGKEDLKIKLYDFVRLPSFETPLVVGTNVDGVLEVREAKPEEIGQPVTVMLRRDQLTSEMPDKDAILKQIQAIRAEKCPEHRNTPLGKKAWQIEQNKRIEALQNQLQ